MDANTTAASSLARHSSALARTFGARAPAHANQLSLNDFQCDTMPSNDCGLPSILVSTSDAGATSSGGGGGGAGGGATGTTATSSAPSAC